MSKSGDLLAVVRALAVALVAADLLQANDVGLRRLNDHRGLLERLLARLAADPDVEGHHPQRFRLLGMNGGRRDQPTQ